MISTEKRLLTRLISLTLALMLLVGVMSSASAGAAGATLPAYAPVPAVSPGFSNEATPSLLQAASEETTGGVLPFAGVGISPALISIVAPGEVSVDTWEDLRTAIADVTVNKIDLNQNIQRTVGATTAATDLPAISRDLTVDGQGFSLDFRAGGAATAIARPGFALANGATGVFTLQNIDIIRPNGGAYSLINNAANYASNIQSTAANTASRGWTVNVADVSTSIAPCSGLVTLAAGTVNFKGVVTWDSTTGSNPNTVVVNAANINVTDAGTSVTLRNHDTGTTANYATVWAGMDGGSNTIMVSDGAVCTIENSGTGSTQAVYMSSGGDTRPANTKCAFIVDGAGTRLNINGYGSGTGSTGATVLMVAAPETSGGGGGFQVTGGAVMDVHAWSPNGRNGMPALLQQIDGGNFIVKGEGTQLNVQSDGASNDLAGVIRIRLVGNQTFTVSDLAQVNVIRAARTGGTAAAAIRFGTARNNSFYVTSGGVVTVRNYGNGSVDTVDTTGNNGAVEFAANYYTFDVSGSSVWTTGPNAGMRQPSAIQLIADCGAAVAASGNTYGVINVSDGAVFIAQGNVNSNTNGIFSSGANFTFNCDNPLYYDFTNVRSTGSTGTMRGGLVFDISGSSSTFNINNSDFAVWRNGRNLVSGATSGGVYDPVSGNPYRSWVNITARLTGSNFATLASSSDPTLNTTTFGAQGLYPYTRVSGNNAAARLIDMPQLTNADKYVRAIGLVPEGLDFVGRPLWDGEVMAWLQRTQAGGAIESNLLADTSINLENVWEQEISADNPLYMGVVRYDNGGFLSTGDAYAFTDVWRGEVADPASNQVHHQTPPDIEGAAASGQTVVDVTPPVPAVITAVDGQPTSGQFITGQTVITGSYPEEQPYNPEDPVSVRAQVVRAGTAISAMSYAGVLDPASRTFSVSIPADVSETQLQDGDQIYILLTDLTGNENPLHATAYHDALFPAGPYLTVGIVPILKKFVIDPDTGMATSTLVVSGATTPITYRIQVDMPDDTSSYESVLIQDLLPDCLAPADALAPSNCVSLYYYDGTEKVMITDAVVSYDPGAHTLQAQLPTDSVSLAALAGLTVYMDVTTQLADAATFPAVAINQAQLVLNLTEVIVPDGDPPVVEIKGRISGVLFGDANRNGRYDAGEPAFAGQTVALLNSVGVVAKTTLTASDGSYTFNALEPGDYQVVAPSPESLGYEGYTTQSPLAVTNGSHVGNDGMTDMLTIDRTHGSAGLDLVANAGYSMVTLNSAGFSKTLVAIDDQTSSGPVTDASSDLSYQITYVAPENTAGYNALTLQDLMDETLELKEGDLNNVTVSISRAGIAIIGWTGEASYDPVRHLVSYDFDPGTDFSQFAGATITMSVTAHLVQAEVYPDQATNTAKLIVNNRSDISLETPPTVVAINISTTSTLTISKTVTGFYGDRSKAFVFTLTFKDAQGDPLTGMLPYTGTVTTSDPHVQSPADGALVLTGGSASVSLSHGQAITIEDVPAGCFMQVAETALAAYTTSFVDSENPGVRVTRSDTALLAMTNEPRSFEFTNARLTEVPSALDLGATGTALAPVIAALLLITIEVLIVKKRQKKGVRFA